MASEYAIWVPALVVSHLLGFLLLLYSFEQVYGCVSKVWRKRSQKGVSDSSTEEQGDEEAHEGKDVEAANPKKVELILQATPYAGTGLGKPWAAELSWKDLGCNVLDSNLQPKRILNGCSGTAYPGEAIALMGPSGAGKTTLLDVLCGRKQGKNVSGTVTMNGEPCGALFRRISALVPQEDVFVATLTAYETLKFHASLTVPSNVLKTTRTERITAVLETMGLWRQRSTKVGGLLPGGINVRGLSGGEKRRLSIACALIANPSVLFLDEPTTGLDSFTALNIMEHLGMLANRGHTIIASIHQPRPAIFDRFNKVVVLSEGHQIYMGPPSLTVDWFQNHLGYSYSVARDGNVPDWIMDTVSIGFHKPANVAARSMTTVKDVQAAAKLSTGSEIVTPRPTLDGELFQGASPGKNGAMATNQQEAKAWASGAYASSWLKQYRVLFKRGLLSQLRNPTDTAMRLLMSTWVGTLAGLVFNELPVGADSTQQRLALLFFVLLLYQLLPFCFMSFFSADRQFFIKDIAAKLYAPSAYYLAAVSSSAPFVVMNTIAGSLMAYGLSGLRYVPWAILLFMVTICLQALVSNQLQIFCVWLMPNQDLAFSLSTAYVASSILLSGFYIRIKDIKIGFVRGLSWLSYTKYAMQGASRIELQNQIWDPSTCTNATTGPSNLSNLCGETGNDLLDYYGYSLSIGAVIGVLLGFYCLFHIGSYLALSRLYRTPQR